MLQRSIVQRNIVLQRSKQGAAKKNVVSQEGGVGPWRKGVCVRTVHKQFLFFNVYCKRY